MRINEGTNHNQPIVQNLSTNHPQMQIMVLGYAHLHRNPKFIAEFW